MQQDTIIINSNHSSNTVSSSNYSNSTQPSSLDVLGEGAYGIVLSKPFPCMSRTKKRYSRSNSNSNSTDSRRSTSKKRPKKEVAKLSFRKEVLEYEYDVMLSLPQGKKYPYAKKSEITFCQISLDDPQVKARLRRLVEAKKIHKEWYNECIETNTLFQLTMPRMGTHSLYSEIQKYRNPNELGVYYDTSDSKNSEKPFINRKRAFRIIHECEKILHILIELNNKKFYHKDVRLPNIMCDFKNEKHSMLLIDFGVSIAKEGSTLVRSEMISSNYASYIHRDMESFLTNVLYHVLACICSAKTYYDLLNPEITTLMILVHNIKHFKLPVSQVQEQTKVFVALLKAKVESLPTISDSEEFFEVKKKKYAVKVPAVEQRANARKFQEQSLDQNEMKKNDTNAGSI